jgi:glycosyltransferase involved in cell wall biosynthesis
MQVPRAVQVARLAEHLGPVEIICGPRLRDPAWMRLVQRFTSPKLRLILFAPDPQRAWSMSAAAHIAQTAPPGHGDLVVTFGQPMSCHLAGLALKERFGVRWIAHWSDPWTDNPMAPPIPFFRARNIGYERAVVERADRIILTSQETADLVMAKYPARLRGKVSILPHAFDASLYPPPTRNDVPTIRYLGTLYGKRGPQSFLAGLAQLAERSPERMRRLHVELVGEIAPRHRAAVPTSLREIVQLKPLIGYAESLALMRSADLLLHLDAPGEKSVFLASKLIDYIGAGRPILGVTPPGTAEKLIRAMGGWVADPAAPEAIASALADALDFVAANGQRPWGNEELRRRFEASAVAAEFSAIAGIAVPAGAMTA